MDFSALTPDEKVTKFVDFNKEDTKSESYIQYLGNKDTSMPKDITDKKLFTNLAIKPAKSNALFQMQPPVKAEEPFTNVISETNKKGQLKTEVIDLGLKYQKGIDILKAKMPNLKDLSKSQMSIVDSIDRTPYDGEMKKYLKLLAYRESTFDVRLDKKNKYGYQGIYQFGQDALDTIKMRREDYVASMENQHKAAAKLGQMNLKGLEKWIGKNVGGIQMTKSGLMAASHLAGRNNLVKFLDSNGKIIFKDGREGDKHRTPITEYLKFFK